MDEEGFSGRDGRTSIFDFFHIDSIGRLGEVLRERAWANCSIGELRQAGLSTREAELLCRYRTALSAAVKDPVFREGDNFDLNWCQEYDRDGFFTFLRCLRVPDGRAEESMEQDGAGVRMVACNFTAQRRSVSVSLPPQALEYCGRPDLPDKVRVTVPAFDFTVVSL